MPTINFKKETVGASIYVDGLPTAITGGVVIKPFSTTGFRVIAEGYNELFMLASNDFSVNDVAQADPDLAALIGKLRDEVFPSTNSGSGGSGGSTPPYKVLVGIVNQSATEYPVITAYDNTLNAPLILTRFIAGYYYTNLGFEINLSKVYSPSCIAQRSSDTVIKYYVSLALDNDGQELMIEVDIQSDGQFILNCYKNGSNHELSEIAPYGLELPEIRIYD